jgi:3alpha(or 20beta)-hydroxysteroid dehydrogenase
MGESHVRTLVEEGATVVFGDILDEDGHALAESLGSAAHYQHLDVTSREEWDTVVAYAQSLGRVTVLVNNAGIVEFGPLADRDETAYRRVVDINQVGVWLGMSAVIEAMKQAGGGSIVNISSSAGLQGFAGISGYVASKWAVRGMTKAAALELGRDGIRVNSIHPGPIRTSMTAGLEDAGSTQPIGRLGEPQEVTNAVIFLASTDSSYITGAELAVDGGQTLGPIAALR